jgi:hypothetical protein
MPSPYRNHLSPREREAVTLARDLHAEMREWLSRRGVTAPVVISPYIDSSGQPNVLVRMNAYIGRAMILSFLEQRAQQHLHHSQPRRDTGMYDQPNP